MSQRFVLALLFLTISITSAEEPKNGDLAQKPQWQRLLRGDDAQKASELTKTMGDCHARDDNAGAMAAAKELYELRRRLQGDDHHETIDAKWNLQVMKTIANVPEAGRAEWRNADVSGLRAQKLEAAGNYRQALPARETALKACRKFLGEEHPHTGFCCNHVAMVLQALGRYDEAGALLRQAVAICQKTLGDNHPSVATYLSHSGLNLNAQGKYAEAEPLFKKALELSLKVQGEDHVGTGAGCANVAFNLNAQGKYAEAEPLFRKALAIHRKLRGENHRDTALCNHNLAGVLTAQAKYAEAEPFCKRALEIFETVLGKEHPLTAASCNNLAGNLNAQGKYADAEPFYKRALAIRQKVFGEEHRSTAASFNNVAHNLNAQGKYADAEVLFKKALVTLRNLLGEDHPDVATACGNVAYTLNAEGKYAESESLYKKALAIRIAALGTEHPDTATSHNNLALNLGDQGKYAEAEEQVNRALAIIQKTLGEGHPRTAGICNNLASNLDAQGNHVAAEPFYRKALAIQTKVLGEEHADVAVSYNNLALNLSEQGKHSDAELFYAKALSIRRKVLGEDHPGTAGSYQSIAANLSAQGKIAEAESLCKKALAIRRKALGENHPDTAASCKSLAINLCSQGRLAESLATLAEGRFSFEASRLIGIGAGSARFTLVDGGNPYPLMCVVQARSKLPEEAFAALETSLARGLLDELASRSRATRSSPDETKGQELTKRLSVIQARLSFLVTQPRRNEAENNEMSALQTERTKLGEELSKLAISLSRGEIATLAEIQRSLKADEAFLAWVTFADPSGTVNEHWGCVLRSSGAPFFEPLPGHGENGKFSPGDRELPTRFGELLRDNDAAAAQVDDLAKRLHAQRFAPLEKHLQGAAKLYVVAVNEMGGIPIETLTNQYVVSYIPSGTFLARLKDRAPAQAGGILALGDPIYDVAKAKKSAPAALPAGGLLVQQLVPGGTAEKNGRIKPGDVLLSYAGVELKGADDLTREVDKHANDRSATVVVWREGQAKNLTLDLDPGKLGVVLAVESAPLAIAQKRRFEQALVSLNRGGEWAELPGTRLELKTLSELFDNRAVLADHTACESRVEELRKNGKLSKFRYLHFASHGLANNVQSFESALILSQDEPKRQELAPTDSPWIDGRLTAREVLEYWKLDADLVTLSACQTALGRQGGGDGLLGFAQAFLLAGSRSVCLSFWEVDDRATALLMDRFYRNLLGKRDGIDKPMRKAEALAEAKKWLRNLNRDEAGKQLAGLSDGLTRGKGQKALNLVSPNLNPKTGPKQVKPFDHPRYWAAFILIGDPS